ncbi:MAG: porin family protein [Bacteroidota bacterium]|nr:porin family protein [Bacteroidota bacterium]
MTVEKDKLRNFMQEAFRDYEVQPCFEDWIRIEKSLSKKRLKRVLLWTIAASAACLLLLLGLYYGGILSFSDRSNARTATNMQPLTQTSSTGTLANRITVKATAEAFSRARQMATPVSKTVPDKVSTPVRSQHLLAVNRPNPTSPLKRTVSSFALQHKRYADSAGNLLQDHTPILAITSRPAGLLTISSATRDLSKEFYIASGTTNTYKKELLAAVRFKGLSLSTGSGLISQKSTGEMLTYNGTFASVLASNMYLNSVKVVDNTYLSSLNIGNLFRDKRRNFLPPVTVGLNVNLALSDNWSIETGIQYTRLQSDGNISVSSSKAVQFSNSYGYKVDETMHYLGIPVVVNCSFSQKRKTTIYASAGISVDKGLVAKYIANPEDNLPGMQSIYSHNAIRGLQYSMNTGLGVGYTFIRHFELFCQPSLCYYFNSQPANTTLYTTHPLLFNLRTGIRYTVK